MGVILVTVIVFVVERSQISNTEICTLSTFFILNVFYTPASGCNCQKKKWMFFPLISLSLPVKTLTDSIQH